MATLTLPGSIPPIVLTPGMLVKLEAIDPSSGAAVTGVVGRTWAIYGDTPDDAGGANDEPTPSGPFMLVPGPDAS